MIDRSQLPLHMQRVTEVRQHKYYRFGPEDYKRLCEERMTQIDALPADIRAIVHEHGWVPVRKRLYLGSADAIRKSIVQHKIAVSLGDIQL